ncbi:hypothetical protein DL771_006083 [Monosporascus sp. 5C6A]|nr:hypothetical protein DL771_006083 [Monosporascus sp. 5C6A]
MKYLWASALLSLTGSTSAIFTGRKFFDFRNLPNPRVPDALPDWDSNKAARETHEYFRSREFTDTFAIMNWSKEASPSAPIRMTNSFNNIYIQRNTDSNPESSTFMTMRTVRHRDFQSAAEFQTKAADYQHVAMTMRARTIGGPGAVSAMFTYWKPEGSNWEGVQEADLEIRTARPRNELRYTNQPSYDPDRDVERPEAFRDVTLPTVWTTWQTHRMEWTPGKVDWYVDGKFMTSISYQAPVDPAYLLWNVWSDGGLWTGEMPIFEHVEMHVQYIEIEYLG